MFYASDNAIAARDSAHLYIYNPNADHEFCYDIQAGHPVPTNMSAEHNYLKNYCFPMLQATEELVKKGLTIDHSTL